MRTSDDHWDLATNMKGLWKSRDKSHDGHVRDGEWPEATTPPDVVVITEMKTNSACSSKMSYKTYQFFEEHGVPISGHHLHKWSVILGVKKGITSPIYRTSSYMDKRQRKFWLCYA